VCKVEYWNAFARQRVDAFGFIDLLVIEPGKPGLLAVQATSAAMTAPRRHKIVSIAAAKAWLEAQNRIEVWGWGKYGARGEPKRWAPKIVVVTVADFGQDGDSDAA
jgi:hypothetical protein